MTISLFVIAISLLTRITRISLLRHLPDVQVGITKGFPDLHSSALEKSVKSSFIDRPQICENFRK